MRRKPLILSDLASFAIHPLEKNILSIAKDLQKPVIKLTDQVIRQKYKPSGKDFDLRATGQLLLLTPFKEKKHSGYKEFHDMNDMALAKYELPYSTRCFMVSFISTLK